MTDVTVSTDRAQILLTLGDGIAYSFFAGPFPGAIDPYKKRLMRAHLENALTALEEAGL